MTPVLLLTLGLSLLPWQGVAGAPAQQPRRIPLVSLKVVTEPADLKGRLESAVRAEFEKYSRQVELTDEGYKAVAVLWIYAVQTTDSSKNPEGVSIAVIHARPGLVFALIMMQDKLCAPGQPDPQVKAALMKLAGSIAVDTPPLSHINAAHLDRVDDSSLKTFASRIVADFAERTNPQVRGQAPSSSRR